MKIKFKKLDDKAVLPFKKHQTDVGLDLTATSIKTVDNGDHGYIEYGIGLAVEVPEGYGGFIFPRSSISDTGLILSNAVGVIDPDYRGELKCRFKYIPRTRQYAVGERVAQIVFMPVVQPEVEETTELSSTERGESGHGSTGK